MQKLSVELNNAPMDTSLVHCSTNPVLNREETLSVQDTVLADNNSEENLRLPVGGHKATTLVYVLNKNGNPLMPCSPTKARHLLGKNKAKVVRCSPFTIQLLWDCEENVQTITLGIDPGYNCMGFSAISSKKELISGEVQLRKDVSKKLTKRRMYRRNKRSKLWYREPRFNNRKKIEGWFAPSIQYKLDSQIRLIDKIKKLLPISEMIIEVTSFDTQKMQNPEISGIEYQQGELQGYEVKEYLLEKWGRKCVYCNKTNIPLEVEHIIPKSREGTNRVSNLTLSCSKCNLKKGNKTAKEFGHPEIQKKADETLKAAAFMNIVRWKLIDMLNCNWTYGYITKYNRIKFGLEKSHINDAFIIAGGNGQQRTLEYRINQIRRNNRCLQLNRKGFAPSIRRRRYNFQPHDLVRYINRIYEVKGMFNKGKYIRLKAEYRDINTKIENIRLYQYKKGWQFISALTDGVFLPIFK